MTDLAMAGRHFTDHLRERGSIPMCRIPAEDLAALAKDSQDSADWLQSQAAEMQRLAARCRKEQKRRKRGAGDA